MEFDVVVVGSGGGAMTAAVTSAHAGLKVLVLEKSEWVGGTTALSGGVIWVPGNPLMAAAGKPDDRGEAEKYIGNVIGDRIRRDMVAAYLDHGPAMVDFLQKNTELQFQTIQFPDYKPNLPGSVPLGRSIGAVPYDGRKLGEDIRLLRPPLDIATALGGMMLDFIDIHHCLNASNNRVSFMHAVRLTLQYFTDRLTHPRGMRLALGNALIGRLLVTARALGVEIRTHAQVEQLVFEGDRVTGVTASIDGVATRIVARGGVVLGSGGFANDEALRRRYLPMPEDMRTMSVESCVGDGLRMATSIGASVKGEDFFNRCLGFPISVMRHPGGRTQNFMHTGGIGRAKPGVIAVDGQGKRFVNEAAPYNDFVHSMAEADITTAYWIFDHNHFSRYGAGMLLPPVWARSTGKFLKAGYLFRANSLPDLAAQLRLPRDALEATVTRFNELARTGKDADFGKGDNIYDRSTGDPATAPNPNLGPLETGPYYAVPFKPGNLGTYVGLETDPRARVKGQADAAMKGLYACGLDAASVFSGCYPGGGSSIGPAMVFGYIAARDIVAAAAEANVPRREAIAAGA